MFENFDQSLCKSFNAHQTTVKYERFQNNMKLICTAQFQLKCFISKNRSIVFVLLEEECYLFIYLKFPYGPKPSPSPDKATCVTKQFLLRLTAFSKMLKAIIIINHTVLAISPCHQVCSADCTFQLLKRLLIPRT